MYAYMVIRENIDFIRAMALMSLRIRSRVKESMVLTIADHLFIHNYISSLLR